MRIWDLPPKLLCRQHLLGEHRELHALWVVLTQNKKGYSRHPETKRWVGKLAALYARHEALVKEMRNRNYQHYSPLEKKLAVGKASQDVYLDSPEKQRALLKQKNCPCFLGLDNSGNF